MSTQNSINNQTGSLTVDPASGDSKINYDINSINIFNIGVLDADDSFNIDDGTNSFYNIDSDGAVTIPFHTSFGARKTAQSNNVTGDGSIYNIVQNGEAWDIGSDFNASNGQFTAPIDGKYILTANFYSFGFAASQETLLFEIVCSNRTIKGFAYSNTTNTGRFTTSGQPVAIGIVDMDAGDIAFVRVKVSGGSKTVDIYGEAGNNFQTSFSGFLIH